jgi:hypothetical protein
MLATLPVEILFQVFSNLSSASLHTLHDHPLLALPLVSRKFKILVETYTAHRLSVSNVRQHESPNRKTFLLYAATHCMYCNKRTHTTPRLFAEITCCTRCNGIYFPEISIETAAKFYIIDKESLFRNCKRSKGNVFDETQVRQFAQSVHSQAGIYLRKTFDLKLKRRMEKYIQNAEEMLSTWEEESRDQVGDEWKGWRKILQQRYAWLMMLWRIYSMNSSARTPENHRPDIRSQSIAISSGRRDSTASTDSMSSMSSNSSNGSLYEPMEYKYESRELNWEPQYEPVYEPTSYASRYDPRQRQPTPPCSDSDSEMDIDCFDDQPTARPITIKNPFYYFPPTPPTTPPSSPPTGGAAMKITYEPANSGHRYAAAHRSISQVRTISSSESDSDYDMDAQRPQPTVSSPKPQRRKQQSQHNRGPQQLRRTASRTTTINPEFQIAYPVNRRGKGARTIEAPLNMQSYEHKTLLTGLTKFHADIIPFDKLSITLIEVGGVTRGTGYSETDR